MRAEQAAWIAALRAAGIAAAHPDDGWVDRRRQTLELVYPDFNDGVQIGSRVALGRPDRYRVVRLTGLVPAGLLPTFQQYRYEQEGE
jgi:hypothetical protein